MWRAVVVMWARVSGWRVALWARCSKVRGGGPVASVSCMRFPYLRVRADSLAALCCASPACCGRPGTSRCCWASRRSQPCQATTPTAIASSSTSTIAMPPLPLPPPPLVAVSLLGVPGLPPDDEVEDDVEDEDSSNKDEL